jgi:hypothetical protein
VACRLEIRSICDFVFTGRTNCSKYDQCDGWSDVGWVTMADDKNQVQLLETADQLKGDQRHLRKLWESHRRTQALIQRSLVALNEAEILLGQIDGKRA